MARSLSGLKKYRASLSERSLFWLVGLVWGLSHGVAIAEVKQADAEGFLSVHTLTIAAAPKVVYRALTREVSRWWDPAHSYSGDARNFRLLAQAGGCLCERLTGGGSVEHLRVVFADANKELRLAGGLGPLQTMAVSGSMVFRLIATTDDGQVAAVKNVEKKQRKTTRLEYSYLVAGNAASKLEVLAAPVDEVQLGQITRLKHWVEHRNPNWPALNKP